MQLPVSSAAFWTYRGLIKLLSNIAQAHELAQLTVMSLVHVELHLTVMSATHSTAMVLTGMMEMLG